MIVSVKIAGIGLKYFSSKKVKIKESIEKYYHY